MYDIAQHGRLLQRQGCHLQLQVECEWLGRHKLVMLEVLSDERTLFMHMPETLIAAEALVKDGFEVMVYCSDDPILGPRSSSRSAAWR